MNNFDNYANSSYFDKIDQMKETQQLLKRKIILKIQIPEFLKQNDLIENNYLNSTKKI